MGYSYQPKAISEYFDEFGVREWERLVRTPVDEISLHIHIHYLKKHISPNQKVLEIGAGAGRFTQVLADLGAQIVVADISNRQLLLNKRFSSEYGFENAIVKWCETDICDLSQFESNTFDSILAYGGPFSYVLDKKDVALGECIRVLRPSGILILSVMSLWGTAHAVLGSILSLPPEINQQVTITGDITPDTFPERGNNFMHLFRGQELLDWVKAAGLEILDVSASNCLSLTWNEKLMEIREDVEKWNELLRIELDACASKGSLNAGTHIIAVVRKNKNAGYQLEQTCFAAEDGALNAILGTE